MKKKLLILIFFLLIMPITSFYAIDNNDVNYNIKSVYQSVEVKNNGDIYVRELYTLDGSFNYFERDIILNNYEKLFDGSDDSYYHSSIYNQGAIKDLKTGIINDGKNPSYSSLSKSVTYFKNISAKNGESNKYTKTKVDNGLKVRIYKETLDDVISFYLEYTITNSITKHNDIAELYYKVLNDGFKYDIDKYDIHVLLPGVSKEFKTFAYGTIELNKNNIDNKEFVLNGFNLKNNENIYIRVLFDKDSVKVSSNKTSNINSLSNITRLEIINESKFFAKKKKAELTFKILNYTEYLYIAFLLFCILFIYLKYDKEYHTIFKGKYYKKFIDEYPLAVIEYLLNKNITSNTFTASILNLIYDGIISVDKYVNEITKLDDYVFTLLNYKKELSISEEKIINMLFIKRGKKQITLTELKKYTLKYTKSGDSEFLNDFKLWKKDAILDCEFYDFYVESKVPIYILIVMTLVTIPFIILQIKQMNMLTMFIIDMIIYLFSVAYILTIKKRSVKGIEEYAKIKAMKRYVKDFKVLNNQNLPDVLSWDKYIIYSTCFGIEDKTSKILKSKFERYGVSYTGDIAKVYNNFMMFTELNKIFNNTYEKVKKDNKK